MPHDRTSTTRRRLMAGLAMLTTLASCSCGSSPPRHRTPEERAEDERQIERIVASTAAEELERFGSEDALRAYVDELARAQRVQRRGQMLDAMGADQGAAEMAAPAQAAAPAPSDTGGESVTNNQVAGVDEGGIVKVHGDHLIVLRRGRLFTVRIGDTSLTPISRVDAYPSGAPGGWYDEMLVHEDTIVVVGFNYQAGGTELGLFDIDDAGHLRRRATHYLRSNDYYSSRNYASRLLGDRLVFYMPYGLMQTRYDGGEPRADYSLPAMRATGSDREDWDEVIGATEIYRPIQPTANPALHTVVTCDLSRPELRCTAQGIVGPWGRSFYVSRDAVYVWVGGERALDGAEAPDGAVYRLPFDGGTPGAVRVSGMPVDQFSFSERDDHLNVLVRSNGAGDWMWAPEVSQGDVALTRLPLAMFSDGVTTAQRDHYTRLPRIEGYAFQNRFVGAHLLYGSGGGWGGAQRESQGQVVVHHIDGGATSVLGLPHAVDRLDVMGQDAVVIGAGGGELHFTAVALEGTPRVAGHYAQPGASQGETRSHGFFYRPRSESEGTLGLPIRGGAAAGWHQLVAGSAGVLYLDVRDRRFSPLGVLASEGGEVNDDCQASCVDWYGNARPLFLRGRVFALLGYELVEGRVDGGRIREVRRAHMLRDLAQR